MSRVSSGRDSSPAESLTSLPPITPISDAGTRRVDIEMEDFDIKAGASGDLKRAAAAVGASIKIEGAKRPNTGRKGKEVAVAVPAKVKVCAFISV